MTYLGDYDLNANVRCFFTTTGSTGAPTALSAGSVSVYEDGATAEFTAGVTLTADFDSRAGLNLVTVATSTSGSYGRGKDYNLVVTNGSVGGVSVVGYLVGTFSIENRLGPFVTTLTTAWAGASAANATVSGGSGRNLLNAARTLRNRVVAGGSVYAENDSTVAWTFATSSQTGGSVITEIDPT